MKVELEADIKRPVGRPARPSLSSTTSSSPTPTLKLRTSASNILSAAPSTVWDNRVFAPFSSEDRRSQCGLGQMPSSKLCGRSCLPDPCLRVAPAASSRHTMSAWPLSDCIIKQCGRGCLSDPCWRQPPPAGKRSPHDLQQLHISNPPKCLTKPCPLYVHFRILPTGTRSLLPFLVWIAQTK